MQRCHKNDIYLRKKAVRDEWRFLLMDWSNQTPSIQILSLFWLYMPTEGVFVPKVKIILSNVYNNHRKEGSQMKKVWNWICHLVYSYGKYSAGQPSYHGSYEALVPMVLQKQGGKSWKFECRLRRLTSHVRTLWVTYMNSNKLRLQISAGLWRDAL